MCGYRSAPVACFVSRIQQPGQEAAAAVCISISSMCYLSTGPLGCSGLHLWGVERSGLRLLWLHHAWYFALAASADSLLAPNSNKSCWLAMGCSALAIGGRQRLVSKQQPAQSVALGRNGASPNGVVYKIVKVWT